MRIGAVRRFDRFFTRRIGVLREGLLHTPYSFTKARVLFEIAYREQLTTSYLSRELGRDPGYLSRIVARLEQQGLIKKKRSEIDARRRLLSLTPRARAHSPCSIHARARRWARCSRSSPKGTSGVC
jgi:DNA-binding MarR family transcriptional regulator